MEAFLLYNNEDWQRQGRFDCFWDNMIALAKLGAKEGFLRTEPFLNFYKRERACFAAAEKARVSGRRARVAKKARLAQAA